MTFPTSAINGQTVVVNGITYTYNNYTNAWTRVQTVPPTNISLSAPSIIVTGCLQSTYIGIGTTTPKASFDASNNTDMVILPSGTTAQRPTGAVPGALRFNTTIASPEWYNPIIGQWQIINKQFYSAQYLLVAGGGGGGGGYAGGCSIDGGGGGAGGMLSGSTPVSPGTQYTVIVGTGGAGVKGLTGYAGGNGTCSIFNGITAIGGGGGGNFQINGANGGSGGGGQQGYGSCGVGGSGTVGQGYAGGSGTNNLGTTPHQIGSSGGGGGAGGVGGNGGAGTIGGAGGVGLPSSISGTAKYYAGGGGGGGSYLTGGAGGNGGGGHGGGPNGGSCVSNGSTAGTANTGGGGGGAGGGNCGGYFTGKAGGSGIAIISYQNTTQRATGGTVTSYTSSSGQLWWVHTFTSSGTYTA
jgi:hypothetical protein